MPPTTRGDIEEEACGFSSRERPASSVAAWYRSWLRLVTKWSACPARARAPEAAAAGAQSVVADLLDRAAVEQAVRKAAPDAIVHVATAIPADINPKKLAAQFELTNRLRTEGARNLFAAAQEVGTKRIISEGLATPTIRTVPSTRTRTCRSGTPRRSSSSRC